MNSTTTPATGNGGIESYVRMIITVVLTVAGSWAAVTSEIHGYIDTKMEDVSRSMVASIGAQASGQMLMVMDSTKANLQTIQDSTNVRLDRMEELIGVRPGPRTIVVPPDTATVNMILREQQLIKESIEYLIDGMAQPRPPRRAHNRRPQ